MGTNVELYEQDFFAWTQATAALIRQGKWHDIDADSVAEELESLGKSNRREFGNRLQVLLVHLLKWQIQPGRRVHSHSWYDTIVEQRDQLHELLTDSPSLRPHMLALVTRRYRRARQKAVDEMQAPEVTLPVECPWTVEQLLDEEFFPEP
jgi:hypothetical protein